MKVKKCIKIICMILLIMLMMGAFSNSYAANFNTDSKSFDAGSSSARSGLHYSSKDGTRYAIRIYGQDLAGDAPAHCYWVYYRGDHYWVGEGADHEAQLFTADNSPYRKSLSIDWKPTSGSANTSNFGLSSGNVTCLLNAIKAEAQTIGDQTVLNKIGQIERGEVSFEIRADIIMLMTYYNKHSTAIDGIIDEPELYLKFHFNAGGGSSDSAVKAGSYYMTYREANRLCDWLKANDKSNYAGEDHGTFKKVAQELFVLYDSGKVNWNNVNYYDEYIGSARSPIVDKKRINDGFDYVPFVYTPTVPQQQTPNTIVDVYYRYVGDYNTDLIPSERRGANEVISAKEIEGYSYCVYFDWIIDGVPYTRLAQYDAIIPDNYKYNQIVFLYDKAPQTPNTIVDVYYRYIGDYNTDLIPSERRSANEVISVKDIGGYSYCGYFNWVIDGVPYTSLTQNDVTVPDNYKYNQIVFLYDKVPYTLVTFYYRFEDDPNAEIVGELVAPVGPTTDLVGQPVDALQQIEKNGENYVYSGNFSWRYDYVNSFAEHTPGNTATVPFNGLNNQIIFWYKKAPKQTFVSVYYRWVGDPNALTVGELYGPESVKAGTITNTHSTLTKSKINYTYDNNYSIRRVVNGQVVSNGEHLSGNSLKINEDGQIYQVIFWYNNEVNNTKVKIKYVLLANKDADLSTGKIITEMKPNPKEYVFKSSENTHSFSYKQISESGRKDLEYVKSSLDGKASTANISLKKDGKEHEIIFGYVVQAPPTIVNVHYVDINNANYKIIDSKLNQKPGTFSAPQKLTDKKGIEYNYSKKYSLLENSKTIKEKVSGNEVTIKENGKRNDIYFLYEPVSQDVVIRYRDYDDKSKADLAQGKGKIGQKIEKRDISNYDYYGVQVTKPKEGSLDTNSVSIIPVKGTTEITFWYRHPVVIRYRDYDDKNKADLAKQTKNKIGDKVEKIDISDYDYYGVQVTKPKEGTLNTKATSTTTTKDATEITFWYRHHTKIKVFYKDENGKDILKPEDKEPGNIPKKEIDKYVYDGVEVVKPTPKPKDEKSTSVKVEDDHKEHEIIFWYRLPKVTIKYVVLQNPSENLKNGTLIKEMNPNPRVFKFTKPDQTKMFTKDQIKETSNNYDYVKGSIDGKETQEPLISIESDGKDHEIIFGYTQIVNIKVIGVCTQNGRQKEFKRDLNLSVTVNKTYKSSDYAWQGYKLISSGNNVKIKEGSFTWLGEKADKEGGVANVSVTKDTYDNKKKQILVIFYYESNFKATVKHIYVNPITKEEKELEKSTILIIPDKQKDFSSKKFENYINLSYSVTPNANITQNGFNKYGNEIYNISFIPDEKNYTIEFRYTSQIIEVRHQYGEGNKATPIIDPVIKILDPTEEENPIPDEEFVYHQVDDGPKQKPTPVKVPFKPGKEKQILVFVYTTPYLIFGDEDPNGGTPVYPDGRTYSDMVKKYNAGIFPNKMNNQLISQDSNKFYWVLDEKGELTIRLAYLHTKGGTTTTKASVKIPFDVYIDGTLYKTNTPITIDITKEKDNDDGCDVWAGKLTNILIPVWTQEKEYTIEATVGYNHKASNGRETTANGIGTAKVVVVGAVYDFSITNIDGSTTTGDQIWKTSLFTNPIIASSIKSRNNEYEANVLPIGQASQQNDKYKYGMKLGTKFYFSVNTKGAKNTAIEITPKFYYYDKNGNIGSATIKSGNTEIINLTKTTTLTDANRTTAEFQKELAQGRTTYGANTYSNAKPTIFDKQLITIGTGLRTPYINYGVDKEKYDESSPKTGNESAIYKNASHWYADYVIPNNAIFYGSDGKVLTEGFVVVAFSIKTKAENNPYLAYNLTSPFNQDKPNYKKQSEWLYEGAESVTLPKTATLANGKGIGNMIKDANGAVAYASAAIYQISPTTRTSQNVDSTGTH